MSNDDTSRALELIRASRRTQIVGQLTAGVYHDFNNVLTIVLAQAGMMELTMKPTENSSVKRSIDSIRRSAERGARLIRRLSDFRNRRILGNGIADLEGTVQGTVEMLDRLFGDHIEIVVEIGQVRQAVRARSSATTDQRPCRSKPSSRLHRQCGTRRA